MTVSPETLLAFADGELSSEEAKKIEAEIANDPSLAAHVEIHRALKARLHDTPQPPDAGADDDQPEPAPKPAHRYAEGSSAPRSKSSLVPVGAMAVGVVLGAMLWSSFTPVGDIRTENGTVLAGGTLARALSMVVGTDKNGAAFYPAEIGESFFSNDGVFCRNFKTGQPDKGGLSGIACRENEEWRIKVLAQAQTPQGQTSNKESPLPQAVREMLNDLMVGAPLDAEGERAARAQSWLVE